ncbi:MAG: hypothetical protein ACQESF_04215 [Nanobdellota archaeon]
MYKNAEMGVGTLIVFIAMLLVAAVAAGVLLQTVSSLQEDSLSTGDQAQAQISTNAEVIEVSATDGRDGFLTDFYQRMKLSPGSNPIRLDDVIFTFNTMDATSTLKYRGVDSVCKKNNQDGYNTWNIEELDKVDDTSAIELEEDYDFDGVDDSIIVFNSTNVLLNLSLAGEFYVPIKNISNASGEGVDLDVSDREISNENGTYAYVTINGETNTNNTIDESVTFMLEPYKTGEGYFSVVYEQEGENHVDGNLQRGDIVRLCYEAPGKVAQEQEVRLSFIPKVGTETLTKFVTPDVMSTERVYLYP